MFEENLIASKKQKRNKNQLLTLPIAVIIHVAAIGGYLLAQVWQVSEVPEPPLQVSFYAAPPPPPPPPAPPKAAAAAPKAVVQQAPANAPVVQPVEIPDKIVPATSGGGGGVEGG
ncbi:MAG: hypothetical protein GX464_08500, partial [Holophagae bacterium]|nr:hypothetical protein [Holophagae bacterium]